jgi:hypothetical protein
MATIYSRAKPRSEATLRAEALLVRYPNLSEQELAELINLFPTLSILDQALMTADGGLSGKLAQFDRDHGNKLRPHLVPLIVLLALPLTFAAFALWFMLG